MASPSFELNYGHPGRPIYDLENNQWTFGRIPGQKGRLQQLGALKPAIPSSSRQDRTTKQDSLRTNRDVHQVARNLGRDLPELSSSIGILPEHTQVSAAIVSTTDVCDPALGQTLSFGSCTSDGHFKFPRRIAATVSGDGGNILRLSVLTKEKHGWGTDRSIWVEGSSLTEAESGYWAEDAAPIQQVCYSHSEDRSSLLALRFCNKTTIFRPSQRFQPGTRSQHYELPASRLAADPILSIPTEQSGGTTHADVTFNPEYQRQIGLVDQKGQWSVWDINGGHRDTGYTISCTVLGEITSPMNDDTAIDEVASIREREDGWARIIWIGNVNTILVCDRKRLNVFDIRGGQSTMLYCENPVAQRSPDWILDIRKHPKQKDQLFVLTSKCLLLLAVKCLNDVPEYGTESSGARILLAWPHYRGADDITLQVSVTAEADEGIIVLLYSRLNTLITIFNFQRTDQNTSLPTSSSDPTQLELNGGVFAPLRECMRISSLHLDALRYREVDKLDGASLGARYQSQDIRFYRLFVAFSNRSVHQVLLYSDHSTGGIPDIVRLPVDPPAWRTVKAPQLGVRQSAEHIDSMEEFVVPDWQTSGPVPSLLRSSIHYSQLSRSKGQDVVSRVGDLQSLYKVLNNKSSTEDAGFGATLDESVTEIIDKARALLLESDANDVPVGILLELAEGSIQVPDVDEASAQLTNLLSNLSEATVTHLNIIAQGHVLHLAHQGSGMPTLSSLYDSILDHWMGPLSPSISSQVRQVKEHLARRVAVEVMLACTRFKTNLASPSSPPHVSQDSAVVLPLLQSRAAIAREPLSLPHLSQPQPATIWTQPPTQPVVSASQPPSSVQFDTPASPGLQDHPNPINRLRQYLQISKSPPTMPPRISKILGQWTPGADPNNYDWEAASRDFGEDDDDEVDRETKLKELERKKRKDERLLKKQRRELEKERRMIESQPTFGRDIGGMRSSPAPVVGMGMSSQAGPPTQIQSQIPSSQPPGMFGFVQSQVEAGRHGGRPPMLKKKKKVKQRIGGF